MWAVQPGRMGPELTKLAVTWPRPRAIIVVSAHWQSDRTELSTPARPETIHDFGGFPEVLYTLTYPAPGPDASVVADVTQALAAAGLDPVENRSRGLDHGTWVPLRYLYPAADIPVMQVALPYGQAPHASYALGLALAPLRHKGILVIGSGSLTHNLYEMRPDGFPPAPYVREFSDWVADCIARDDLDTLANYRLAPSGARAHPSPEHFLPLFVALGAAGERIGRSQRLQGDITNGVLSMDAYLFEGVAKQAAPSQPEVEHA